MKAFGIFLILFCCLFEVVLGHMVFKSGRPWRERLWYSCMMIVIIVCAYVVAERVGSL